MNDTVLDTAPTTTPRAPDYTIYKPNSRGNGAAIRFGLNRQKAAIFVDGASQIGERQFDWENKMTMKWGLPDIGTVLAALQGRTTQAKLFHQTDKGSSALEITLQDDPDRAPYLLSMSRQNSADKALRKVVIPLSQGEAAVLEAALRVAVAALVGW